MAEISTIARPYATAIFNLAKESKSLSNWSNMLGLLSNVVSDDQIKDFIADSKVLDSARGLPVFFRTLDIGSDKILPSISPEIEPNPALGWRAIRLALEKSSVLKMQAQALIRGARGRDLTCGQQKNLEKRKVIGCQKMIWQSLERCINVKKVNSKLETKCHIRLTDKKK